MPANIKVGQKDPLGDQVGQKLDLMGTQGSHEPTEKEWKLINRFQSVYSGRYVSMQLQAECFSPRRSVDRRGRPVYCISDNDSNVKNLLSSSAMMGWRPRYHMNQNRIKVDLSKVTNPGGASSSGNGRRGS